MFKFVLCFLVGVVCACWKGVVCVVVFVLCVQLSILC